MCASDVQSVLCKFDSDAAACVKGIPASGCTSVPAGCMHTDIADGVWAAQACNEYVTTLCSHNVTCGSAADVSACVAEAQGTLPCARAVGIKTNYEQCLQQVKEATCCATYPAECKSLILLADTNATTG